MNVYLPGIHHRPRIGSFPCRRVWCFSYPERRRFRSSSIVILRVLRTRLFRTDQQP
jgi:hypothetical protein